MRERHCSACGPRPIGDWRNHLAPLLLLVVFFAGLLWPTTPAAVQPPREAFVRDVHPAELCAAEPRCVAVPLDDETLWLSYDPDALTAPVTPSQLAAQGAESVAVRLVLSEVGAGRLLRNAHGLDEAVAVLQVVFNRLDPAVADPDGLAGYRPYPGCGAGAGFVDCANPRQFLGLATRRALRPAEAIPEALLLPALDRAVLAWRLVSEGGLDDPTGGATQFVHRCGGAAYGQPTTHCDEPVERASGADPYGGPLVLLAPAGLHPRGHYRLRPSAWVDYRPES
ncbi:MAG: hypothetical protein H6739_12780 [Alphaproteobacteria bacterium]|nr:hypothetical protein [Alphaproteobacteria bacterium]